MPKREKDQYTTGEFIDKLAGIINETDKLGDPYWRTAFELTQLVMDAEITDIDRQKFPKILWNAIHDAHTKAGEAVQALEALKQLIDFFIDFEETEVNG